jgi:hypothetical protein
VNQELLTAETTATAVRGVSHTLTRPCLDEESVPGVVESVVVSIEILGNFGYAVELSNTAYDNTGSVMEDGVGYFNVGTVGLERNAVVTVPNMPSLKMDVVGEHGISAISIDGALAVVGDTGNVKVFQHKILG